MPKFLDPIAGFGVTFATIFKKANTEFYPEEKKQVAPRYHGRHQLNRHPDGLEKCIGCELCAWACPADAIYVEGADNTEEQRFSPGERYGRVYQINYLRCIFCGLCIEACPTRALTMTNDYELADASRENLIFEKQDLLAPLTEGMVPSPHPMYPGMTEDDYYHGRVTEASPDLLARAMREALEREPVEQDSVERDGIERDGVAREAADGEAAGSAVIGHHAVEGERADRGVVPGDREAAP